MKRYLYIIIGSISLAVGAVGTAIPLLPGFPFLLLAAVCFGKSSKRLHDWFIGTKLYQNNLESYVQGKGMTMRSKIRIAIIVTITMTIGFIVMRRSTVGRIVLSVVWIFHVVYFFFGVKTISQDEQRAYLEKKRNQTI